MTSHGAVVGTPNYMSPEQVRGDVLDPRSDLFSLSALLYEFVSLTPPFSGDFLQVARAIVEKHPPSLRSLAVGLPDGLDELVRQGMAKDLSQRPPSAAEFRAALQAVRLGTQEAPTLRHATPRAPALDGPDVLDVDQPSAPDGIFASENEGLRDHRRLYAFAAVGVILALILVALIAWPRPTAPALAPPPAANVAPPEPSVHPSPAEVRDGSAGRRRATRTRETQVGNTAKRERAATLPPPAQNANSAAPATAAARPEVPVDRPTPIEPVSPVAHPAPTSSAREAPARIDVNTSDDRPAVEQLLADFARAHNERDVPALKQLYPSLPQAEAVALTRAFVDYDAYRVSLSDVLVSVTGDQGRVRCRMSRAITPSKGDSRIVNAVLDAAVERIDGAWVFTRLTLQ